MKSLSDERGLLTFDSTLRVRRQTLRHRLDQGTLGERFPKRKILSMDLVLRESLGSWSLGGFHHREDARRCRLNVL